MNESQSVMSYIVEPFYSYKSVMSRKNESQESCVHVQNVKHGMNLFERYYFNLEGRQPQISSIPLSN